MPDKGSPVGSKSVEVSVRKCAIHSVVVYKDRAEVKRVVSARVAPGDSEVVITGLTGCIDRNSVRVEGKGDGAATITDVVYLSEMVSEERCAGSKEEFEQLKSEIKDKKKEKKYLQLKKDVLTSEKSLLTKFANHVCAGHSTSGEGESLGQLVRGETVADVMGFLQRFEAKLASLDDRLLEVSSGINKLEEKIRVLQANADRVNPERKEVKTDTVRSLKVCLECGGEVEVTLIISYVVSNASWSSAYDVRVFSQDKAMKVQYYGLIQQSTGEDWEDASISLSTAQPSIGGAAPPLPTKIIRFHRAPPRVYKQYNERPKLYRGLDMSAMPLRSAAFAGESESENSEAEFDDDWGEDQEMCHSAYAPPAPPPPPGAAGSAMPPPSPPPPPALSVATAEVSAGLFNATYAIPRTNTIPADNTEHKVTVALIDLQPELHYVSVPRLSSYSFLQAQAKNTSLYTMLAGPANVFLDNNFIVKTELNDVSPNEQFTTSLGADPAVHITCQPITIVHGSRSGITKKNHIVTYTHLFEVRNMRPADVSIQVSEQVPLSTDDRIKVTVANPDLKKRNACCSLPSGYAVLNDDNNVEWHVTMATSAVLTLKLVYTVEYPQQDDVLGLPK